MSYFSLEEALERGAEPGNVSFQLAGLGDAELKFYVPKKIDRQTPHSQMSFI